jgi:hypothetical protein
VKFPQRGEDAGNWHAANRLRRKTPPRAPEMVKTSLLRGIACKYRPRKQSGVKLPENS